MANYRKQTTHARKATREKGKVPGKEAESSNPESCRCKEVAKKTPREMLNLMISDLAFWKKAKGNK